MKNVSTKPFIVIALAIMCLILASCYFGISDDVLVIPFDREWGELLIDGEPQAPVDDFVRIQMSPAARVFEFRPNAGHGWSFKGWLGVEPNPFLISDVPYSSTSLSEENPVTLVVDEAFVSTYVFLAPQVERFDISAILVNSRGESALMVKYPDGSKKTFIADPAGANARDVTPLLPFQGDYCLIAFSDSRLIAQGYGAESGLGSLEISTGAWSAMAGAADTWELASTGGKRIGRIMRRPEGENEEVEIYDGETGALLYARDFLMETGEIRFLNLTETRIFYARSLADSPATQEIRSIDIATGTDTGIPFGKSYRWWDAASVAGGGTLALFEGHPSSIDGIAESAKEYFLYDPDAGSPYPLKSGNPELMDNPVLAGTNEVYVSVYSATTGEFRNVLWDYTADTRIECAVEGTILFSNEEGLYVRYYTDRIVDASPFASYVILMLHRADGTGTDITPYAAILQ